MISATPRPAIAGPATAQNSTPLMALPPTCPSPWRVNSTPAAIIMPPTTSAKPRDTSAHAPDSVETQASLRSHSSAANVGEATFDGSFSRSLS